MQGSTSSLVHCLFVVARKPVSGTQAFVSSLNKDSLKMNIHMYSVSPKMYIAFYSVDKHEH